jgi:tetratricopeptide (TPR) repeat protein
MTNGKARTSANSTGVTTAQARPSGQLWQVPAFLMGILALVGMAYASPLTRDLDESPLEADLVTIRRALEKPGTPTADLVLLAEGAVGRANRNPARAAEAHYLMGTIYLRLAARTAGEESRDYRQKATLQLELARLGQDSLTPEDNSRLQYQRGKLTFMNNGEMALVCELISANLPGGADFLAEGYAILTEACLRKNPPDLDKALAANQKLVEACEEQNLLDVARLQRGDLLLKKNKRAEALATLDLIGPKAAPAVRLKARQMQAQAAMDENMWAKAIQWWNEVLAQPELVPGGKARIYYNLGMCNRAYDPPAHYQEAQVAWLEAESYTGEESQAASLRLAELMLAGKEPDRAFVHFQKALEKVHTIDEYRNLLVTLSEAKGLVDVACKIFEAREDTENLQTAAELLRKLAPAGTADERIAEALENSGRRLLEEAKAEGASDQAVAVLRVRANDALQRAAMAYERSAEKRAPAECIGVLWHCIECYRLADEPLKAIDALRQFVNLPAPPMRKAEAWFTLGDLQRQLKKYADASASYKKCVECNDETFTARALLHLAEMAEDEHNLADAEAMLVQIVRPLDGNLTDRPTHRTAMLMLVNLYYHQKQFDRAARQCTDLIKEDPAHPFILSVRETLGQCYRSMAWEYLEKSKINGVSAESKQQFLRERMKNLELAKEVFQSLATDLNVKAASKPLPPAEESLRRQAAITVADCYFELPNSFEEAFRSYYELFKTYSKDWEGLRACYGLTRCVNEANAQPEYANLRVVLEAADWAVEECIKNFESITRGKDAPVRDAWGKWLEDCRVELKKSRQKT